MPQSNLARVVGSNCVGGKLSVAAGQPVTSAPGSTEYLAPSAVATADDVLSATSEEALRGCVRMVWQVCLDAVCAAGVCSSVETTLQL